jgi:tetratricopeptide (TPR) repeat protein
MELYAEKVQLADGRNVIRPRSLEPLCGALPAEEAWQLVIQIADSLAFLHRKHIIHCNLKPSNVLFGEEDSPHPMLSDFAQGMLGGIEQIDPGASLFYASPEQLRDPDHIFEGRGEKWDVYSFGVTAFRLLTATYPRLNAAIGEIGRRNANQLDLRLKISPVQIADALTLEEEISWPSEPSSELEREQRRVIETCLHLDPAERYVDMREVLQTFRDAEKEIGHADQIAKVERGRDELATTSIRARGRAKMFGIGAIAASAIAAFGLYDKFSSTSQTDATESPAPITVIPPEEDPAFLAEHDAKLAAESKLASAIDNLRHTQGALDSIFEMIAARDGDGNALYDIPEGTLGTVLNYYDEFVTRHSGDPEMGESLAGALHNSGQLHMMLGDYQGASANLANAASLLESLEAGGDEAGALLIRRASVYEDLSDAQSSSRLPRAAVASSKMANQIFTTLAERNAASASATRALAANSLRVARKMADGRQHGEAGRYIERADELLAQLEEDKQINEDDLALLAESSFERGRVERMLGNREAAVESQINSIDRYLGLLEARPDVPAYRFQLARSYGEAADLAALLGEPDEAVIANKEASELLRSLADSNADKPVYRHQLARRLKSTAAQQRDAGKGSDALAQQDKALVLLEDLHKSFPGNREFAYDFAIVSGIQADLSAEAKKNKEAIVLSERSVTLMQELLTEDTDLEDNNSKRPKYRKALAALYGKLGYHTEKSGDKENAKHCYEKSLKHYQTIAATDPENKGAAVGVEWAEKSLARLP